MTKSLWTAISYLQLLEVCDQDRIAQTIIAEPVLGSIASNQEREVDLDGSIQTILTTRYPVPGSLPKEATIAF